MSAIRIGCKLEITKQYFSGSYRNSKFDGESILNVMIIKHSYGALKNQHTFTCKVMDVISNGSAQTHEVGDKFRIKGRNLYPSIISHIQGIESINLDI